MAYESLFRCGNSLPTVDPFGPSFTALSSSWRYKEPMPSICFCVSCSFTASRSRRLLSHSNRQALNFQPLTNPAPKTRERRISPR